MSCGQGFVKIFMIIGIFTISKLVLFGIKEWDEEFGLCNEKDIRRKQIIYCVMMIGLVADTEVDYVQSIPGIMILGIYLVVCSVTDMLLCQVHDIMQYFGVVGAVLWLGNKSVLAIEGICIILFALLQYTLFIRMYGKADGMAFCICALYLAGKGIGLEGYLYHMFLSFLMLTIVQLCRKNVSIKGKLKEPVALYPYITTTFCVLWWSVG